MQAPRRRVPTVPTVPTVPPGVPARALAAAASLLAAACGRAAPPAPAAPPGLQVVGEATRLRVGEVAPAPSPFFDGREVRVRAARGEVLGLQLHGAPGEVRLTVDGVAVTLRALAPVVVRRPSTSMWGGSRGAGAYLDRLLPVTAAPAGAPLLAELEVPRDAAPGPHAGRLEAGGRAWPVTVDVAAVTLPPLADAPRVWAYLDPRELGWAGLGADALDRCAATFRRHGVLLSPDLATDAWPARRASLAGVRYVPVQLSAEPAEAAADVARWIAQTRGTGQLPFAIPVDEPRRPEAYAATRAVAAAVRAAGGGPDTFLMAVTGVPRPEYGDLIDLYLSPRLPRLGEPPEAGARRWTYNGAPPRAGAMVVDAEGVALRTWGWIAWRWNVPVWYVWDALYWHDRHGRHGAPLPGKALDVAVDAVSFDDGEDHGNLDGVLAFPAPAGPPGAPAPAEPCAPTLRLATLRRGLQDRALLELAAACAPGEAAAIAARLVPRALGDAPDGEGRGAWPEDEAAWEAARQQLLDLAARPGCAAPTGR